MMESETPPFAVPSGKADNPEVSSQRVSSSPARPGSSAPTGVRPVELQSLLERASLSEDHPALMSVVIQRISSAKSGLHEAVGSLLTGFEVRKKMTYLLTVLHIGCAL